MKKLKAREQHKCTHCNKPAEYTNGKQYSCANHKVLLKHLVPEKEVK